MAILKKSGAAAKKAAPKVDSKLAQAQKCVEQYEERRGELEEKKGDFETEFPEAQLAINDIKKTEDEVRELIETAKVAVRGAGQTVGDFRFVAKSTTPGYLPEKVLEVLCGLEDTSAGETLKLLYKRGVISAVKVDKDASRMVKAGAPGLAELLEEAWDAGGTPLTPNIFTPSL